MQEEIQTENLRQPQNEIQTEGIQQQQQQTNKSIKNQNKNGDVTARILARVNRHMNTTPIPTNHDTPDINLPKANNKTNNQTEHKQNNKETIENKNIQ